MSGLIRATHHNSLFRFAAALEELDLEGDWDPSKHDAQMAALYTEEISGDAEVSKIIIFWE